MPVALGQGRAALLDGDGTAGPGFGRGDPYLPVRVLDGHGVTDRGLPAQRVLKIDGGDGGVQADVGGPPEDLQHAFAIEHAEVTGAVPAAGEVLRLLDGPVPVALGHRWGTDLDQLRARVGAAVGAAEPDLNAGLDPPGAAEAGRAVVLGGE